MDWNKLRENKCPKCGKDIKPKIDFGLFWCSNTMCSFRISPERFNEIINSPPRFKEEKHYRPRDEEPE